MLVIYTIIYFLGTLLYFTGHNIIASAVITALAIFLYVVEFILTKRFITVRGLFGLSFVGGFGISLLKLSNLSMKYLFMTFMVVFVAYFSLYVGVYAAAKKDFPYINTKKDNIKILNEKILSQDLLFIILFFVTFISFAIEAVLLGFVPFFTKDTPHAYSTFHIYGLHYITTLYVFLPSIAMCNYFLTDNKKKNLWILILSYVYVIAMSVLLVSRSQLISSIILSVFVLLIYRSNDIYLYVSSKGKGKANISISKKTIATIFSLMIIFIALYIFITINRAHDKEYLNGIFDMKNKNMPLFVTQPYMYIAHNFENLNYMIENLFRYTFGRRILFPFFTLTLVKKYFPIVVDSPIYVIKQELSTKTLVYDFYYDFGLVGVIVFCFLIGYVGKLIEEMTYERVKDDNFYKNNYVAILFALYSYYMFFSFFQTYFSLTDTWVHLILLTLLSLLVRVQRKKKKE